MLEFRGVFPAIITPMTSEGDLNEPAFREVMEFNIQAGVHGFWTAGGTGESIMLSDEENNRIAEISADQNAGRVKNIMHVGAPTTTRAANMAEYAAKVGVEAICCVPPFFYNQPDEEIVEHYRVVGAASNLPLLLYNLPGSTGVEITPELASKIQARVPQLAGLKHSSMGTFANVKDFKNMGLSCLIGSSKLMLPALTMGASGCVDGPLCAAPDLWVKIWDAYNRNDIKAAEIAQDEACKITDILVKNKFQARIKAFIGDRLGIDCGSPRPPGPSLTAEEKTEIVREVARLGWAKAAVIQ